MSGVVLVMAALHQLRLCAGRELALENTAVHRAEDRGKSVLDFVCTLVEVIGQRVILTRVETQDVHGTSVAQTQRVTATAELRCERT